MKIDKATLIGLIISSGAVLIGLLLACNFDVALMAKLYIDYPSVFITGVGSLGAVIMTCPMAGIKKLGKVIAKPMQTTENDNEESDLIVEMVGYATEARRNGVLSLDAKTEEIKDAFVRSGIQLAVDGTAPEQIEEILQLEIDGMKRRHTEGQDMLLKWAELGPAYGMIGTLIGLIAMLANLSDAASIGPAMAVALITTLYGAGLANLYCIPLAYKLRATSAEEVIHKEMVVAAVLAIQNGDNPRIVQQKLLAYVSPDVKKVVLAKDQEA
ncbi:MAG: motility protein [Chlamydiales bacterium]|jgi:chemotaxis protein MotA|nr:motility protein [Chlamydiales bacterium]